MPNSGYQLSTDVMSQSAISHKRFCDRAGRRKIVAAVYMAGTLVYLGWRTTILNEDALALSLVYFAGEILGFVLGLTTIFSSWDYRHRLSQPAQKGLSVDVFIPTYKEPADLVRWTVIAAKEIAYPHQTFLLDDGNRPEMKALAQELGVRYLARTRNTDAKAGNLNNALAHSTADFIAVFDADHIALPNALDAMLGFFRDERVAMVQTPQDYYNVNAFQFSNAGNGALWHDQSFFYQIAQSCRDFFNGASCVGTSVVYRRAALDAIGGIPSDTVTEDIHTSLKLHKAGYEVVFLNETVAYGVAAADIRDYYKTRHRWAHGNLHALRIENVLFCKGLTLGQRLSYLTLGLIYLEGWQQLLLFVVPVVSLLLGWAPFDITVLNVIIVLFFPIFTLLLLQELGCGLSRPWVNEIFSMARFPVHIAAVAALAGSKMPFRTSSKNVHARIEWLLMTPQLAVLAVSFAAFSIGVVTLGLDFKVGPLAVAFLDISSGSLSKIAWTARLDQGYTLELVMVSGFWALFNAAKAAHLIRKAINNVRCSSEDYRFDLRLPMEIKTRSGIILARVDRLSRSWMSARIYGDHPALGERLNAHLHLPAGPLAVEGRVAHRNGSGVRQVRAGPVTVEITNGAHAEYGRIECDLVWKSVADRDLLTRALYAVDWHREFMHRNATFSTPLDVLGRLLALRAPFRASKALWTPALYSNGPRGERHFCVVEIDDDKEFVTVLAFRRISPGAMFDVEMFGSEGIERRLFRIIGAEPARSLTTKGLDGAILRKYRAVEEKEWLTAATNLAIAAE